MARRSSPVVVLGLCALIGACARPLVPPAPSEPASQAKAAEAVRSHLARFDGLSSLTLRVERQTTRRGQTQTERWTFRQKGPTRFRVDYEYPVARLLVANESELWEYIPAARAAARTDLAAMAPDEQAAFLRGVLSRVALQGLRFGQGEGDARLSCRGLETVAGRRAHCVEYQQEGAEASRRVRGWIDAERLVLLRCEFLDERGQVLATTEADGVFEAAPGLWLPRRLTLKQLGGRGLTQVAILKHVTVNADLPDALFGFRLPEGVRLVEPTAQ